MAALGEEEGEADGHEGEEEEGDGERGEEVAIKGADALLGSSFGDGGKMADAELADGELRRNGKGGGTRRQEADGENEIAGLRERDGGGPGVLAQALLHGRRGGERNAVGEDGELAGAAGGECNAKRAAGVDDAEADARPGVTVGFIGEAGAGEGLVGLEQGPAGVVEGGIGVARVVGLSEAPRRFEGEDSVQPRGVDDRDLLRGLNGTGSLTRERTHQAQTKRQETEPADSAASQELKAGERAERRCAACAGRFAGTVCETRLRRRLQDLHSPPR